MLKLWRSAAGLEPLRSDCSVERIEGIDADAIIGPRMRAWYLRLLDTAPAALLPVADVAGELVLTPDRAGGSATAVMPQRVRRLLDVRLTGWLNAALPRDAAAAARRCRMGLNPYLRPGLTHPMCLTDGHTMRVEPFEDGDIVAAARAVCDPGPERYTLDESLLATIPINDESISSQL